MPLQFAQVPVPFRSGLDTKTDPKNGELGTFLELENAVFTKIGGFQKRPGYVTLATAIENGAGAITAAKAISVFNDELLLYTGSKTYSYIAATGTWSDRGSMTSCIVTNNRVTRSAYTQSNPDIAYLGGIYVTVWEDSRGGVRYAVHDATTGATIVADTQVNATATKPRVLAFAGRIVIFVADGANLRYYTINPGTPTVALSATSPISSLATAANHYDVVVTGNTGGSAGRLWICWNDSAPATKLNYLDSTMTLGTAISPLNASDNAIAIWGDGSSNVWIAGANSTTLYGAMVNYATTTLVAIQTIETVSNVQRITGYTSGTTGTYYYEVTGTAAADQYIRKNTMTSAGTVGTAADFMRSVGLWGRAFTYSSLFYVPVVHQSTLQSTIFVVDTSANVVARVLPTKTGGLRSKSTVSNVPTTTATGIFAVANTEKAELLVDDTATPPKLYTSVGIGRTDLDFVSGKNFSSVTLGQNLLTAGGVVQSYDGVSYTEHGFHLFPEDVLGTNSDLTPAVTFAMVITQGTAGSAESTDVTVPAGRTIKSGQYWKFYGKNGLGGEDPYYVWYNVNSRGTDPAPGGFTAIPVAINDTDTANQVATKTRTAITSVAAVDVTVSGATNHVIVTNINNGNVTDAVNAAAPDGVETGSIVAGSYQYRAVYSWVDNFGQIHRSFPSIAVTANGSTARQCVTIPTLRVTSKTGTRLPVRIDVYRTVDNGTIFYRVSPNPSPILNDLTVDTVTFVDTLADASITSNELLYTTGGFLEHTAPPSASLITTYRTRVFLGGLEDRNQLTYSDAIVPGEPVTFNDALLINVDPTGGPVTALGVLDDKLVIFKRDAIYAMAGDGPNPAGQDNDYSTPVRITADAGCSNPQSVVTTPVGLMFQSTKGIYLLDRSLQVSYVGARVEAFNSLTITSSALVPNTNQVRFLTATSTALVYDYQFQQWSTFTGMPAVDCDVWRSGFIYARSDGTVWQENTSVFTDADGFYRMKLTTSWIAVAGLQGFQRVQRAIFVGDYKGAHTLQVSIGTDFNDVYLQTATFAASSLIGGSTYGSDSPYGSGSPYGGTFTLEQFQVHIANQKCEAIRFSVEDLQSSAYNEGYRISGLTLQVGLKKGHMKLPAARRA